jgi:predicted nucleotidyltransferase
METTKNELSPYANDFFNKLKNYLNTKLYFFGSIQRYDYFPKKSDIDVDIFTDNETKTISQIQNFLNIEKKKIKKFVYKFNNTTNSEYKLVSGYKIKYSEPENSLFVEFSIYNEKYKEFMKEHADPLLTASLSGSHNDIAKVLYAYFSDEFRCACFWFWTP